MVFAQQNGSAPSHQLGRHVFVKKFIRHAKVYKSYRKQSNTVVKMGYVNK